MYIYYCMNDVTFFRGLSFLDTMCTGEKCSTFSQCFLLCRSTAFGRRTAAVFRA